MLVSGGGLLTTREIRQLCPCDQELLSPLQVLLVFGDSGGQIEKFDAIIMINNIISMERERERERERKREYVEGMRDQLRERKRSKKQGEIEN